MNSKQRKYKDIHTQAHCNERAEPKEAPTSIREDQHCLLRDPMKSDLSSETKEAGRQ
jgi:hypothetical protein